MIEVFDANGKPTAPEQLTKEQRMALDFSLGLAEGALESAKAGVPHQVMLSGLLGTYCSLVTGPWDCCLDSAIANLKAMTAMLSDQAAKRGQASKTVH